MPDPDAFDQLVPGPVALACPAELTARMTERVELRTDTGVVIAVTVAAYEDGAGGHGYAVDRWGPETTGTGGLEIGEPVGQYRTAVGARNAARNAGTAAARDLRKGRVDGVRHTVTVNRYTMAARLYRDRWEPNPGQRPAVLCRRDGRR